MKTDNTNSNYHNMNSREGLNTVDIGSNANDYFAVGGAQENQLRTYMSGGSKASSGKNSVNKGPKALTSPQMTQRMEHIY